MTDPAAIVHAETTPTAIQREAASILDVIARAATDPTVNVEKLERLLAIQERLLADQRRTSFMAALGDLQAKLPQISKAGRITDRDGALRNRYAKIEDIDMAIRPLCAEFGFAFSFDSKATAGGTEYSCKLSHRDGHSETKALVLPLDSGAGRNAVQSAGSSISYAKRYLLGMHLHLVTRDEDDDGNGGHRPVTAEQAAEVRAALASVNGNEARFLNWLAARSFEEIPAANYDRAMKFIDEKRKAAGQ
jgi:hypothetical protein